MNLQIASCADQYKKSPQLNRNDVLELLEWQKTQPHLPNVSEFEAITFLYACYLDIEKAKKCMDLYFTVRTHCPETFSRRDVFGDDIKSEMKYLGLVQMPGVTNEGYRVIIATLMDPDPSKFNFNYFVKFYNMALDYWVARDGIAEGLAIILDMDGTKLSHLTKVNIASMRKFLFYVQEALPIRLREIHFINIPSWVDKLLAMMTPFIKKELMNGLHLHKTLDTFVDKFVPKTMLPDKYGGTAGNLETMVKDVFADVQANSQFYVDEEANKRVNEQLRPGKPKTDRDLFGFFFTLFSGKKSS